MSQNIDKLNELVGFDVNTHGQMSGPLFNSLLDDIRKDREEKVKVLAKQHLEKAFSLSEQIVKLKKESEKNIAKAEKEIGKLLSNINNMLNGKELVQEEAEK